VQDTDVDGFNLGYAITPGTFEDLVEFVVPELQRRGAYQTEYAPGTLRSKLFGRGDHLPDEHRGAGFRHLGQPRPQRADPADAPVAARALSGA
jgi:hypothetical protein